MVCLPFFSNGRVLGERIHPVACDGQFATFTKITAFCFGTKCLNKGLFKTENKRMTLIYAHDN